MNILSKEELSKKIEVVEKELRSYTWWELETNESLPRTINSLSLWIPYAENILAACGSGKHKGQTKISHRGYRRFRYWLFQATKSAVSHAGKFK